MRGKVLLAALMVGVLVMPMMSVTRAASLYKPDLYPEKVDVYRDGNGWKAYCVVRNGGDAGADSFYVAFFVDGRCVGMKPVNGLSAGNSVTCESDRFYVGAGFHELKVIVDYYNDISEKMKITM